MAAGSPSSSLVLHSQHGHRYFPFPHLKHTLSHLFLHLTKACPLKHHDHDDLEYHPSSASLPSVPVYILAESAKQQLPAMPYGNFLERSETPKDQKESCDQCIVCLNRIELSHEVKVPFNCRHVFHRECLDAWVDQGQGTCPLCRSKLLPSQDHDDRDHDHQELLGSHDHDQVDPWRLERMVYLFGDDCLFCQL